MTAALLSAADLAVFDQQLTATDRMLARQFPGDDGSRQPVHTVYVPADTYTSDLPRRWGAAAQAAIAEQGGIDAVLRSLQVPEAFAPDVARLVTTKLEREPIEDLRLDFEDGYGDRGRATEDADVCAAAKRLAAAHAEGSAPAFFGIRCKCFEAATRQRGIRSLDLFLSTLLDAGDLPDGLVLTLPKVSTVAQVEVMVQICRRFEEHFGLTPGRLRFEVQVETPQLILGPNGSSPLASAIHVAEGRVSGLHYGTYDYSASLGIAAAYQSMEHPAADHAKQVMLVAAAQTGVRLSDGSTNILPVGDAQAVDSAWQLSARLTRRSLERGYYQGWDLHPAQLVPRFIANTLFYREGFASATTRLDNYLRGVESAVMDEPATARALAAFVARGLACGAVTADEITATGIETGALVALAHPRFDATQESA
ncbi:DUF6986 family protein [Agrococcus sp. Ld7]|uniref:DUF6986 family protein n=1 Tax=Agrococcus sp. Ld7 TaxID=649148 RepID=UPI003868FC38